MRRSRHLVASIVLALTVGALLRGLWLTADPPTTGTVGIVWHDEGAWVHNARNKALWGTWRTDAWNPLFIAPVFTYLEYIAFRELGVGTWQARTVPLASGLFAIAALAAGLAATGGTRSALIGALLLATNYVFVMWNRAALMESTMTAFMVGAWGAYALAHSRGSAWGLVAGTMATLAWFSKAAAAFFVAAIAIDALITLTLAGTAWIRTRLAIEAPSRDTVRAATATLLGVGLSAAVICVMFVLPHWNEYRFYNWQMSVMRKPSYALSALVDRASWLPLVHDSFTRMWMVLVAAALASLALVARWRVTTPPQRLLVLWLLLGLLELIVHDAGNERRYVMFVPVLIALASVIIGSGSVLTAANHRGRHWLLLPLAALLTYLVVGSLLRVMFVADIKAGQLQQTVRLSAIISLVIAAIVVTRLGVILRWLSLQRGSATGIALLTGLAIAGDLAQYAQWARDRTDHNYRASRMIGTLLPDGTLVHGKLANGLALENRIRPIFIGRGFGNYADRTTRDDVRYVLTYVAPYVGYEGRVIQDVLNAYPRRTIVATFTVSETAAGYDRAVLIDKFGVPGPRPAQVEPLQRLPGDRGTP
jgi:4-amino-4-deoxy-L-arabinose transferase-like glycosyltransferase